MTAMRSKHPDQIVLNPEDVLVIMADECDVDGTDQTLAAAAEVSMR
jgi:hypothetical protein